MLITPSGPYDVSTGNGELTETICNPGDVLVQRSTLHSYVSSLCRLVFQH